MEKKYVRLMNRAILSLLYNAARISTVKPSFLLRLAYWAAAQLKAQYRRSSLRKKGIHVPPYLIVSITGKCNLNCTGCYARVNHSSQKNDMTDSMLDKLFSQADDLGISFILTAGGEPLTRKNILDMSAAHPGIIFPIFTNGLLLDSISLSKIASSKNIIPVVSLEGNEHETDLRRGTGVYGRIMNVLRELDRRNIFFGVSLTVTSENINVITDDQFIDTLTGTGCRVFLYVEFIPARQGTEGLVPDSTQRTLLEKRLRLLKKRHHAVFISFPGDEDKYGGCMSAGRGFVHISPEGNVEPCPFSPYSVSNIQSTSLRDALHSEFLKTIRDNRHQLDETDGGCALWNRREWVQSLLSQKTPSQK